MFRLFHIILSIVAAACFSGCGVKSPEPAAGKGNPVSEGEQLPKNVHHTVLKKFLVFVSQTTFNIGVAKVRYTVLLPTLQSPTDLVGFKIKYFMPEMPEMPVTPAVITVLSSGQIEVGYDISMGGAWEFRLEIISKEHPELGVIDQFIHNDVVKE